jgi:phosphohistidine phosphatase
VEGRIPRRSEGLVPELALVSPAVRTQETWKFSTREFGTSVDAETAERLYDATPDAILALIKETPAKVQSLLVIGHNPGLHELALMLVASGNVEAREQLQENLPTAGLVIVDLPFDEWRAFRRETGRLERFVTPKFLRTGKGR